MKTFIVSLLAACGLFLLSGQSDAASGVRGAKGYSSIIYTTTVSSVAVSGPAVVYSVVLGTGTAGTDYLALFDSASIGGLTANNSAFKLRVNTSSTTQNTVVSFDPPIQFQNGIVAGLSVATTWATVTYERGRVGAGY